MSYGRLGCTATTTPTSWWTWWHGKGAAAYCSLLCYVN
jgi:hypothetical protein